MDYNFESFQKSLLATVAPNFYKAQAILAEVDLERITDPELYHYVEYCKELALYCVNYGIDREALPTFQGVLGALNFTRAVLKSFGDSIEDVSLFKGLIRFVGGGIKLKLGLAKWFEIHQTLLNRYKIEEPQIL